MRVSGPRFIALAVFAPVVTLAAFGLMRPEPAVAHPLGNFTVNRYSRLELYADAVRIRYVLDMAEIPAFQEIPAIDANADGELSPAENDAYLAEKAREIAGNLHLTAGGAEVDLEVLSSEISYPEGQAGLRTLRLALLLGAPVSGAEVKLEYRDENYADRVGWKEVVVRAAEGVTLFDSSAPSTEASAELTSYPADLLSSPLEVTSAGVTYVPGDGAPAPVAGTGSESIAAPREAPARAGGGFASLIDSEDLTLPVVLLSLLLALGFGAIHALEPGHGKTFVAAYFVGVKGTVRQALGLGLIVASTHTIGVLVIGLITLFGSRYILPEHLYPWLSLASGLVVLALGVRLIAARAGGLPQWRRFVSVVRRHNETVHDHEHDHGHTHEAAPGSPPWRSLLALGLADGLTPSPSALIVLLAAVSLDRIGLGILLIAAFSVGLAAVLTLVSLALLYARRFVEWLGARKASSRPGAGLGWITNAGSGAAILRIAPVGGALGLVAIGLVLTVRALSQPGLPVF